MKFICSKSELVKGVQTVQTAITGKGGLPILANMLVEAGSSENTQKSLNNKIKLVSTDLEVGIKCNITGEVIEKGAVTIPAKKFNDIVKEFPEKEIQIEVLPGNKITISCEKITFKVIGLPKDEFPIFPEFKRENNVKIKQSLLKSIIKKTIFAISLDETRYVLNGIYLQITNNKIEVVTTDGRRLAYIIGTTLSKADKKINVIIPSKAMNELNRLLTQEGEVIISFSDNQICFELGDILLISRLIDGRFPNYEQVIPKSTPLKVKIKTEELFNAVKRIGLLAPEKAESIKLTMFDNKMIISANTQGVGEAEEEIDIAYKGEKFEVAYNPKYIGDVLKNIETEEITLGFSDAASPAVIRPEVKGKEKNTEQYLCVIMPMRI